jgi:hypothetical protein
MTRMVSDGVPEHLLWKVVELLCRLPGGFISHEDPILCEEDAFPLIQRHRSCRGRSRVSEYALSLWFIASDRRPACSQAFA